MSVELVSLHSNRNFLDYYHDYIKREWRRHYFSYDVLKAEYKVLKSQRIPRFSRFEKDFLDEIMRVDWFMKATLFEIQQDLRKIATAKSLFLDQEHISQRKPQDEKTIEITLRVIYEKCEDIEKFYSLNRYAIYKIAKKFEKLIDNVKADPVHAKADDDLFFDFDPWVQYKSSEYFSNKFIPRIAVIQRLTQKCKLLYQVFFRRRYPTLAEGELQFVKNKARVHKHSQVFFGLKLGAIGMLIIWLVVDSNTIPNDFDFWQQPGLFMYTIVGNLLLFRFLWSGNIFVWSRFDINYIPIMSFSNNKPNTLMIVNTTATWMLLYCVNLMIFYFLNGADESIYTRYTFICPFVLVAWTFMGEIYDYLTRSYSAYSRFSRGLFSRAVLYRCLWAPFSILQFRDIYAADVLTSFTKVISDTLYGTCWVLSSAFLTPHDNAEDQSLSSNSNFGSRYMQCTSHQMVYFVALFECIPLWIRFLQCCRQSYDAKGQVWPFSFNALKYLLSMLVVLIGIKKSTTSADAGYVFLIVLTALYKWWWDVVMDWGLFDILPAWMAPICPWATSSMDLKRKREENNSDSDSGKSSGKSSAPLIPDEDSSHLFLRSNLMFPYVWLYYVCIVLDLILRFLWVVSLVPESIFGSFVGPKLSLFLGSMEICRRAMWGCFRLEYEHLKHVQKGSPGFLKFRRLEYLRPGKKVSQRYDLQRTDNSQRLSQLMSLEVTDDSMSDLARILESAAKKQLSSTSRLSEQEFKEIIEVADKDIGDEDLNDDMGGHILSEDIVASSQERRLNELSDSDEDDVDDGHGGDSSYPIGSFSSDISMQSMSNQEPNDSHIATKNPMLIGTRGPIAPFGMSHAQNGFRTESTASTDTIMDRPIVSIDHGADV